jgi:hypothetical protein
VNILLAGFDKYNPVIVRLKWKNAFTLVFTARKSLQLIKDDLTQVQKKNCSSPGAKAMTVIVFVHFF